MSAGDQPAVTPRVLFFGLPSGISAGVLSDLIAGGTELAGVVVPAGAVPHLLPDTERPFARVEPHAPTGLALAGPTLAAGTLSVAWAAGLPVLAVRDFAQRDSLAALADLAADVAVVACFTQRIPAELLRLPQWGFLNLHPSLLPAYRGPTPVFWQLREGARTGVTVHYMDEGLDTGDIAAQSTVDLPDGISGPEADRQLMQAGRLLLRGVLMDLARGAVQRQPQPPGGSYFGYPGAADFSLSTDWPARRAFNFMRGTADYGQPYPVEVAGKTVFLATADHFAADVELDRLSVRHGRNILIRFSPGILYAHLVR